MSDLVVDIILNGFVRDLLETFPFSKNGEHSHDVRIGRSGKTCGKHGILRSVYFAIHVVIDEMMMVPLLYILGYAYTGTDAVKTIVPFSTGTVPQ
jgi:hypothetical protein